MLWYLGVHASVWGHISYCHYIVISPVQNLKLVESSIRNSFPVPQMISEKSRGQASAEIGDHQWDLELTQGQPGYNQLWSFIKHLKNTQRSKKQDRGESRKQERAWQGIGALSVPSPGPCLGWPG